MGRGNFRGPLALLQAVPFRLLVGLMARGAVGESLSRVEGPAVGIHLTELRLLNEKWV